MWTDPESGEIILSATIITCTANAVMKDLHNRMPVILDKKGCGIWLEEGGAAILKPCPDEWLKAHPVTPRVGHSRYQGQDTIDPF